MQSIQTIAGKVGTNLVKAHLHSGRCHKSALILLSHLQVSPSKTMRSCKMMSAASETFKGFFYEPEEVIEKSDYYLFHQEDGDKVHEKVISYGDLTCWCQKEFEDLADFAEEELLCGQTVMTEHGVVSVEAAKGVDLESDVELEAEAVDR